MALNIVDYVISQNPRTAGAGRPGDHLIQPPAKAGSLEKVIQESKLTGGSTNSLGSFLQCSVTLKVFFFFSSCSRVTSYVPVHACHPLFCYCELLKRAWFHQLSFLGVSKPL